MFRRCRPIRPLAVEGVAEWIEREAGSESGSDLTLVGSSLGGFYATHLAERFGARAVLDQSRRSGPTTTF